MQLQSVHSCKLALQSRGGMINSGHLLAPTGLGMRIQESLLCNPGLSLAAPAAVVSQLRQTADKHEKSLAPIPRTQYPGLINHFSLMTIPLHLLSLRPRLTLSGLDQQNLKCWGKFLTPPPQTSQGPQKHLFVWPGLVAALASKGFSTPP